MEIKLPNNELIKEPLLPKVRGDRVLRLNISRNTLIAFVVSLIIHAILLLAVLPKIDNDKPEGLPPPMEVTLAPTVAEVEPVIPPPPAEQAPEPEPAPKTPKVMTQKPKPNVKPIFTVPEVLEPKVVTKPEVSPPKEDAPKDMAEYIKMQQAKREGADSDAARQNAEAVAREVGPTAEQIRDERIKKNLEGGSGGIFSVSNVGTREATLTFNGWKGFSAPQVRSYMVEASGGQDIRRMVVKKAISIIRIDYPKEFPWESRRLGRTVTKSSKIEDNAELEEFLMSEFSDMYRN